MVENIYHIPRNPLAEWRAQKAWKTFSMTLVKLISVISGLLSFSIPLPVPPSKWLSVWQAGVLGMVALRMCLLPFNSLRSPRWVKWSRVSHLEANEIENTREQSLGAGQLAGGRGHRQGRGTGRTGKFLRLKFKPCNLKGDFKSLFCSTPCASPLCL